MEANGFGLGFFHVNERNRFLQHNCISRWKMSMVISCWQVSADHRQRRYWGTCWMNGNSYPHLESGLSQRFEELNLFHSSHWQENHEIVHQNPLITLIFEVRQAKRNHKALDVITRKTKINKNNLCYSCWDLKYWNEIMGVMISFYFKLYLCQFLMDSLHILHMCWLIILVSKY